MRCSLIPAASLLGLGLTQAAWAEETARPLDLGLLRNSEISVVQKLVYTMDGRSEMALALGVMPFDPYTVAPVANFAYTLHTSETWGWELSAGGGYGIKNGTYRELEGPAYGVAPEAYRYLGRLFAGAEWTPAYAKLNWRGQKVIHYNTYGLAGVGAALEQSVIPTGDLALAPGLSLGLGMRMFRTPNLAVRVELRDDVLIEHRKQSDTTHVKQDVAVLVGLSRLGKASGR